MSFSSDVKMELAGNVPGERDCQIAELAAMISMVAYVRYWAGRPAGLVIVTERSVIAKEIASLIKRLFRYIPDSSVRRTGADSRVYRMEINSPEIVNTILMTLKIENEHEYEGLIQCQLMKVSRMDVQQDCCRRAYIKGVFMTSGSISDPNKSYHFEIVCHTLEQAQQLKELMEFFETEPKIVERKERMVVYLKEGSQIVEEILRRLSEGWGDDS